MFDNYVTTGRKLYVIGGCNLETGQAINVCEVFNTETGIWEEDFRFRKGEETWKEPKSKSHGYFLIILSQYIELKSWPRYLIQCRLELKKVIFGRYFTDTWSARH